MVDNVKPFALSKNFADLNTVGEESPQGADDVGGLLFVDLKCVVLDDSKPSALSENLVDVTCRKRSLQGADDVSAVLFGDLKGVTDAFVDGCFEDTDCYWEVNGMLHFHGHWHSGGS